VAESVKMTGMRNLMASGEIRHVGVSNYGRSSWQEAEVALGQPVVTNQVCYSLLTPSAGAPAPALRRCQQAPPYCLEPSRAGTAFGQVLRREGTPLQPTLDRVLLAREPPSRPACRVRPAGDRHSAGRDPGAGGIGMAGPPPKCRCHRGREEPRAARGECRCSGPRACRRRGRLPDGVRRQLPSHSEASGRGAPRRARGGSKRPAAGGRGAVVGPALTVSHRWPSTRRA
jgi:hypothetical protein